MKRKGKDFSRKVTPLFATMMVQDPEDVSKDSEIPTDPQYMPIVTQPQKKQKSRRKQRKEIEVPSPSSEIPNEKSVPTNSNDPLPSGLKRLRKSGSARRVESSTEASLGDQENASKQERIIDNINQDIEIMLVDDTQGRMNEEDMFRVNDPDGDEVVVHVSASEKVEQNVKVIEKEDELTLAQTLIEIKAAKPKAITIVATTVTVAGTRPKEKGIVMQEPSETPLPKPIDSSQQPSKTNEKGKAKMIKPKKPLKKKDQIIIDEEVAKNLEAQMQAELEEEERLTRQKEEEANIALIESWDNTQAMMDADCELATRLQKEEIGELSIEEKSRLFLELMDKRKKHFVRLRAEKIRMKPPTKAQKRNQCMLFNNSLKWIKAFVPMDTELVKGNEKTAKGNEKAKEGSSKRAADKLEQKDAKRQRIE
nr:hypothetical protein [Tanacetum cinerariifolium]